jgi:hypothetical protein
VPVACDHSGIQKDQWSVASLHFLVDNKCVKEEKGNITKGVELYAMIGSRSHNGNITVAATEVAKIHSSTRRSCYYTLSIFIIATNVIESDIVVIRTQ